MRDDLVSAFPGLWGSGFMQSRGRPQLDLTWDGMSIRSGWLTQLSGFAILLYTTLITGAQGMLRPNFKETRVDIYKSNKKEKSSCLR